MAYRTTRAFRDQLYVLSLHSQLEAGRAAADGTSRRRWAASRARRRVPAISNALAGALQQPSLRQVGAGDLLPGVGELLEADFARPEIAAATPPTGWFFRWVALTWAGAWLVTLGEVAAYGISDRATLDIPELVAIALTIPATVLRIYR
jgi:hypothetical protein